MKYQPTKQWALYWGMMPLPTGATAIGLITRDTGETGALIRLANGNYVQGNAGGVRNLPRHDIDTLLKSDADKDIEYRGADGEHNLKYF